MSVEPFFEYLRKFIATLRSIPAEAVFGVNILRPTTVWQQFKL